MNGGQKQGLTGFTMIEIMVVVVIVAILAAIAVPVYVDYVESARASEAKSVIGAIKNAAEMYRQNFGEWPADVDELERTGQLDVDPATRRKWVFELQLPEKIIATSTSEMVGGEGKVVEFDRITGKYRGYGSPETE